MTVMDRQATSSAARHIARAIRRPAERFLGRPERLSPTPFVGQTLGPDDVRLAEKLLSEPDSYLDEHLVRRFESDFVATTGCRYAFAFRSGREALSAALQGLDLHPGDQSVLPGYTCVVVPNAFRYAGVEVVYADIEAESYGIDITDLRQKVTRDTKVILLQHLYGLVSRDYEEVLNLASERGIAVIEDCAHSTGAQQSGLSVGLRGDVAVFSSEQSKVLNTIRGGVVVTESDGIAERIAAYRDSAPQTTVDEVRAMLSGIVLGYAVLREAQHPLRAAVAELRYGRRRIDSTSPEEIRGVRPADYGRRMAGAIAALASNQLSKMPDFNAARRKNAKVWDQWCRERDLTPPFVKRDSTPVFLRYPVQVPEAMKNDPSWARRELGFDVGLWFTGTHHPVDRNTGLCPVADACVRTVINLPTLGIDASRFV